MCTEPAGGRDTCPRLQGWDSRVDGAAGCVRPEVFAKALGFAPQDNGAACSDPHGCYRELEGGAVVGKGCVLGLVLQAFLFSSPPLILEQGAVPP